MKVNLKQLEIAEQNTNIIYTCDKSQAADEEVGNWCEFASLLPFLSGVKMLFKARELGKKGTDKSL